MGQGMCDAAVRSSTAAGRQPGFRPFCATATTAKGGQQRTWVLPTPFLAAALLFLATNFVGSALLVSSSCSKSVRQVRYQSGTAGPISPPPYSQPAWVAAGLLRCAPVQRMQCRHCPSQTALHHTTVRQAFNMCISTCLGCSAAAAAASSSVGNLGGLP